MKKHTIVRIGALAGAVALLLSGCSSSSDSAGSGAGDKLSAVMYSSNNETVIGVVTDAAAAADPAVKVEAVTGSSGPLLERIATESASPASDVFYSAPAATFEGFAEHVEPYLSPEASEIPAELVDSENRWTAANAHVVAFMVNVDQIDGGKAPTSWKDLTKPEWAGKIMAPNPEQSTTGFTALYGAYKVLGAADFEKLVANLELTESTSNVYPAVAQGEYAVSIGYESNIYPYIAGGQAGIEMVYPEDGTFVEYDSVFLVKGGPNPEGGKALIDVILSKEAQEQNLEQSFRRPVRTDIDVASIVDFKNLDELALIDIHGADDDQGRTDFTEYWKTL